LFFSSFWQNLGFAGGFYSVQFLIKKELKIVFSSFWQGLGFAGCVFSI